MRRSRCPLPEYYSDYLCIFPIELLDGYSGPPVNSIDELADVGEVKDFGCDFVAY